MQTESPIRITETSTTWASVKGTSAYGSSSTNIAIDELGLLLKNQTFQGNGRALVPSRSGSAPPSMEGSFAAAKNILAKQNFDLNTSLTGINASVDSYVLAEKKLHADSAYVAYSSDVNMSPRTTPSLIPRDNRRLFRQIGSAGYNRRLTSSDDSCSGSLLMSHSKLSTHKEELEDDRSAQRNPANGTDKSISFSSPSEELEDDRSAQRNPANGTDKSISFSSPSEATTGQLKGVLGTMEEDISDSKSNVYSQGPFFIDESVEEAVSRDADGSLHDPTLCTSIPSPSADDMQQSSHPDQTGLISSSASLASVTSTLLKPDLHRTQSLTVDSDLGDYISTSSVTDTVLTSIDSNMNSTSVRSNPSPKDQRHNHEQRYRLEVQNSQSQFTSQGINHAYIGTNQIFHGPSNYSEAELQPVTQSSAVCPPLYATAAADHMNSSALLYQNLHPSSYFSPQYTLGGYAFQSEGLSPYVAGYVPQAVVPVAFDDDAHPNFSPGTSFGGITSYGVNMQHLNNYFGQFGFPMQPSITDPLHMQYFQHSFGDAYGLPGRFEFPPRAGATGNPLNAADSHKGSGLSVFSVEQNFQHQGSVGHSYLNPGRVGFPYYIGRPRDAGLLQFPVSTVSSPPGTPVGGTSLFSGTNEMRFSPRSSRNLGISYGWQGKRGPDDFKSFSFLEELKSGKGRRVELSDIVGHIIEFSGDQHGSRFIQQKLESCSVQEKEAVFKEVLPNTSKLMTDVFGNYVIQKFFEYGSLEQRKQLANQLAGQILPLSLQMYGCRVIQKALDVIEPEQKIKLVHELDGHVLRCVRDQNGNHVIQKCIETIPTFQIEFIISSFRGEVAKLSTHPYGCRVIQRVLEHCTSDLQSQFIVDEILESVCLLAQDQYGNYVIQHVLERGKPSERRLIISKLSEHIVQLSQHKFASNVVEKCLEYGDSASLEIMIEEIIGQGDGNDNLLTMVKDQYANYVIQKIIQTSNADQREMLLGRIRIHLNSLKKYTYGKHIVTRFERLYGEDLRNKDPDNFTE